MMESSYFSVKYMKSPLTKACFQQTYSKEVPFPCPLPIICQSLFKHFPGHFFDVVHAVPPNNEDYGQNRKVCGRQAEDPVRANKRHCRFKEIDACRPQQEAQVDFKHETPR